MGNLSKSIMVWLGIKLRRGFRIKQFSQHKYYFPPKSAKTVDKTPCFAAPAGA
jgi:hypothetical protein